MVNSHLPADERGWHTLTNIPGCRKIELCLPMCVFCTVEAALAPGDPMNELWPQCLVSAPADPSLQLPKSQWLLFNSHSSVGMATDNFLLFLKINFKRHQSEGDNRFMPTLLDRLQTQQLCETRLRLPQCMDISY